MRIVYRPMRADDRSFVVGSWLASYRRAPAAGMISMERWSTVMVPEIERVLARPSVRTLVAADAAATDNVANLFAHLVWEPGRYIVRDGETTWAPAEGGGVPLVYYVYVKHEYRTRRPWPNPPQRFGFARCLFRAAGIDPRAPFLYVCRTRVIDRLEDAGKIPNARWRPLLGRQPRPGERDDDHHSSDAA